MTKLTRLKINKFRNVEPVELKFSNGLNVLLGINGSGKTTFLELIAALLSENLEPIRDEEFSVAFDLDFDKATIQVNLTNTKTQSNVEHHSMPRRRLRPEASEMELRVKIELNDLATGITHRIESDASTATISEEDRNTKTTTSRTRTSPNSTLPHFYLSKNIQLIKDENLLSVLAESLYPLDQLSRFDESLGFFNDILREDSWIKFRTVKSKTGRVVFDSGYGVPAVSDNLQLAVANAIKDKWRSWQGSEIITIPMHDGLHFLEQLANIATLRNARLELRFLGGASSEQPNQGKPAELKFGMFRFWFEKFDGTVLPEKQLSYGQKRLLSFFYYLDCNPTIVIADELAAGLHHAWISACLEAIGDRQAFLASHDPILIDEIDLGSIEDVERSFLLCRCDTSSGKERLSWSNMSRHDAERFFEAYNVGLQHVSEILRTQRLW